jgi:hypothetical protein
VNDQLDRRLGSTLQRQAGTVDEGPRFTAEDLVRAGRMTRRRRRRAKVWTAVAAAASIAALAIVIPSVLRTQVHDNNLPTTHHPRRGRGLPGPDLRRHIHHGRRLAVRQER